MTRSNAVWLMDAGIPKPIPRARPLLTGAAGMPLSPVREVHSPTSAAAAQRQMEARRLFSPSTRSAAQSQPRATGRGFAAVNGRAGRAAQQERGGKHGQRGGRRRGGGLRDDQPNGTSAPVGLLAAALGREPAATNGVSSAAASTQALPLASDGDAGTPARGSVSGADSDGVYRGHGRVSRGRRGRELAPAAPPELARISPTAMASVASSDTASNVSAPSGHTSRTDTDTGRQHGRGEGGRGRSRCECNPPSHV